MEKNRVPQGLSKSLRGTGGSPTKTNIFTMPTVLTRLVLARLMESLEDSLAKTSPNKTKERVNEIGLKRIREIV